ncbi:MAG: cytochrome c biogenesis protein CcsA [Opitutales bacterium]
MVDWLTGENGRTLFALAAGLYLLAALSGAVSMRLGHRYARSVSLTLIAGGFLFQTLAMALRGIAIQACPLGNPFEILQFMTWSGILVYLTLFSVYRLNLLGLFTALFAGGIGSLALAVPRWDHAYTGNLFSDNPWIETHASLAVLSYGIFGLLFLICAMYLIQQYGLKHKQASGLFRLLPSIMQLERVGIRLLATGQIILTLALLVGLLMWVFKAGTTTSAAKLLFTVVPWIGYGLAILLHARGRLVGPAFARTCVVLFGVALLSVWPVDADRPTTGTRPVPPTRQP